MFNRNEREGLCHEDRTARRQNDSLSKNIFQEMNQNPAEMIRDLKQMRGDSAKIDGFPTADSLLLGLNQNSSNEKHLNHSQKPADSDKHGTAHDGRHTSKEQLLQMKLEKELRKEQLLEIQRIHDVQYQSRTSKAGSPDIRKEMERPVQRNSNKENHSEQSSKPVSSLELSDFGGPTKYSWSGVKPQADNSEAPRPEVIEVTGDKSEAPRPEVIEVTGDKSEAPRPEVIEVTGDISEAPRPEVVEVTGDISNPVEVEPNANIPKSGDYTGLDEVGKIFLKDLPESKPEIAAETPEQKPDSAGQKQEAADQKQVADQKPETTEQKPENTKSGPGRFEIESKPVDPKIVVGRRSLDNNEDIEPGERVTDAGTEAELMNSSDQIIKKIEANSEQIDAYLDKLEAIGKLFMDNAAASAADPHYFGNIPGWTGYSVSTSLNDDFLPESGEIKFYKKAYGNEPVYTVKTNKDGIRFNNGSQTSFGYATDMIETYDGIVVYNTGEPAHYSMKSMRGEDGHLHVSEAKVFDSKDGLRYDLRFQSNGELDVAQSESFDEKGVRNGLF